jgi:hypothetical protein
MGLYSEVNVCGYPLEAFHRTIFVHWFQTVLIEFALVVHLFDRECQGLVEVRRRRNFEIKPCAKLTIFYKWCSIS